MSGFITSLRRLFLFAALSTALLAAPAQAGDGTVVDVYDFYYDPASVNVELAGQVTWYWLEGIHDVVAVDGSFVSDLGSELSYANVFYRPGTFYYWCTLHAQPSQANEQGIEDGFMVGKVVVDGGVPDLFDLAVSDQNVAAGTSTVVIDSVTLDVPGYVVIYSDDGNAVANNDQRGVSGLLPAGTHTNVPVELDELPTDGFKFWARLHTEEIGDGFSGATEDWAAHDPQNGNPQLGGVVAWPFTVSVDGTTPDVVPLYEGWNGLDPWQGPYIGDDAVTAYFTANIEGDWEAVAYYDGDEWLQRFKNPPLPSFNTLDEVIPGQSIWIFVPVDGELTIVP